MAILSCKISWLMPFQIIDCRLVSLSRGEIRGKHKAPYRHSFGFWEMLVVARQSECSSKAIWGAYALRFCGWKVNALPRGLLDAMERRPCSAQVLVYIRKSPMRFHKSLVLLCFFLMVYVPRTYSLCFILWLCVIHACSFFVASIFDSI